MRLDEGCSRGAPPPREFLHTLRHRERAQADEILERIAHFRIARHFRHVVGGVRSKRDALIEACSVLGSRPDEALFVGDLLSDILDGKAAGMTTVLYAPADSPHAGQAHHHITELERLKQLLTD